MLSLGPRAQYEVDICDNNTAMQCRQRQPEYTRGWRLWHPSAPLPTCCTCYAHCHQMLLISSPEHGSSSHTRPAAVVAAPSLSPMLLGLVVLSPEVVLALVLAKEELVGAVVVLVSVVVVGCANSSGCTEIAPALK